MSEANRFAGDKITTAVEITASGDNDIRTPQAGKAIRLFWVYLSAPETGLEVLAIVKLGAEVVYRAYLGAPGVFSHWEPKTGKPDAKLIVNLSGARTVQVNYTAEEI